MDHQELAAVRGQDTNASDAHLLLQMRNVNVRRGRHYLLDGINLEIGTHEHVAFLGANGSGKSTLVQLLARRLYPLARDPAGGEVRLRLFGRARCDVTSLRKLLGVVSAEQQAKLAGDAARLQAFDVVVSGFFASHGLVLDQVASSEQRARAQEALAQMGVAHLADRRLATLSSGEARRVLIARALVHRPRALLLDEPCAGLDMVTRRQFLQQLRRLANTGVTLLLVTHHVEEIIPEINRLVFLQAGRLVADGDKQDLLQATRLTDLYGAPVTLSQHGDWYQAGLS